jgi:adenine-specific DNA-methyltransferase
MFYLNEGRTNIDFVYEIMLKFGMPLTAQVKEERIGDIDTYGIDDGVRSVLVCLDEHVGISDIEKMADTAYGTLIFADRCFDDANMLINTEEVLKKKNKQMRLF